jgi:hypothetical protein
MGQWVGHNWGLMIKWIALGFVVVDVMSNWKCQWGMDMFGYEYIYTVRMVRTNQLINKNPYEMPS